MNRINVWWCTNDPNNTGWYGEVRNEQGDVIDDTMKVWFLVDVDQYGRQEGYALQEALEQAYPGYQITLEGN